MFDSTAMTPAKNACATALWLMACLPGVALANHDIARCDTLFALRIAEQAALPDCDNSIVVTGRCTGLTANQCQLLVYNDPAGQAPPAAGNGALLYAYLPRCLGGTDVCRSTHRVHCLDGTRPIIHADKARNAAGDFIESNRWLFYVSGGGSCFGSDCWTHYSSADSQREMSTCHPDTVNCASQGSSHISERLAGEGLMSPDASNPFADFNRVRINKCAYDGFQGDEWESNVPVDRDGDGKAEQSVARLYHQGHQVYRTTLNWLARGVALAGGVGPVLPPLAAADLVLLTGNSGGGKAMIMTGDLLRDHLEQNVLTNPQARVRLIIDAHFLPNLENEARFGTNFGAMLSDNNGNGRVDVFDHHFRGIDGLLPDDPAQPPAVELYSDWTYAAPTGRVRQTLDAYVGDDLSSLDASCVATHANDLSWCRDEHHVLLNHVSTPFFLRIDLRDNAWIDGSALFGAAQGLDYNWPDSAFEERVDALVRDYLRSHRQESEIALGLDGSGDPGCLELNNQKPGCWPRAVWAPSLGGPGSHTGLLDAFHFGTGVPRLELSLCEDVKGTIVETPFTAATALVGWLVQNQTFEARPFFDASGGGDARYWVSTADATCTTELNCGNGLDDDGDGDTDSADSDCP